MRDTKVLHCVICDRLFDKDEPKKAIEPLNILLHYENFVCVECEDKISKGKIHPVVAIFHAINGDI